MPPGYTHWGRLVPEEVDGVEPLVVEDVEAVSLVPALREDIKADHTTCQQREVVRSAGWCWKGAG